MSDNAEWIVGKVEDEKDSADMLCSWKGNKAKLGIGREESRNVNKGTEKRMKGSELHKGEYTAGW